ncbi:hypothetical protein Syun_014293 [Stephania yunnanensis]|uniref:Uncharacterized protein n=1 Tax=Stephania yunnanensis TaxID=152371 RepID=A0AAP0P8G0_9MAGN
MNGRTSSKHLSGGTHEHFAQSASPTQRIWLSVADISATKIYTSPDIEEIATFMKGGNVQDIEEVAFS